MWWTVRNSQRLGVISGQPAAEETPDLSFEGGRGLAHFSVMFPAGEGGDAGERDVGGRLQAGSHLRPGGRAAAGARSPFTLMKFAQCHQSSSGSPHIWKCHKSLLLQAGEAICDPGGRAEPNACSLYGVSMVLCPSLPPPPLLYVNDATALLQGMQLQAP